MKCSHNLNNCIECRTGLYYAYKTSGQPLTIRGMLLEAQGIEQRLVSTNALHSSYTELYMGLCALQKSIITQLLKHGIASLDKEVA